MKHASTSPESVRIEVDLPHAPEQVWLAITDADLLARWLAPVDLRPQVGAQFRLPPAEDAEGAPMIDCEIVDVVPNRMLRWRQTERSSQDDTFAVESIVTLELLPIPHGTRMRIVHDQFRRASIEARAAETNVIRFPRRPSCAARITCALNTFRQAA